MMGIRHCSQLLPQLVPTMYTPSPDTCQIMHSVAETLPAMHVSGSARAAERLHAAAQYVPRLGKSLFIATLEALIASLYNYRRRP